MTRQGTVEASIHGGADASLLAQQLDGRLVSEDSLRTAVRVCLDAIPSAEEALRDLGMLPSLRRTSSPRAGGTCPPLRSSSVSLRDWRISTLGCRG